LPQSNPDFRGHSREGTEKQKRRPGKEGKQKKETESGLQVVALVPRRIRRKWGGEAKRKDHLAWGRKGGERDNQKTDNIGERILGSGGKKKNRKHGRGEKFRGGRNTPREASKR